MLVEYIQTLQLRYECRFINVSINLFYYDVYFCKITLVFYYYVFINISQTDTQQLYDG